MKAIKGEISGDKDSTDPVRVANMEGDKCEISGDRSSTVPVETASMKQDGDKDSGSGRDRLYEGR